MYELPELEVIRTIIAEKYTGSPITKVTVGNKTIVGKKNIFLEELEGATVWFVERRAGHLVFHLDTGKRLVVYLEGQSSFYGGEPNEALKSGAQFVLHFGNKYAAFFELAEQSIQIITVREVEDLLKVCGPDPLDKRFTLSAFKHVLSKKRNYIKTLLLDASIVSGIGAIYSDEILFQAKISPNRKAYTLTDEEAEKLFHAMQNVLKEAIADGGTREKSLFLNDSFTGSYRDKIKVYNRMDEPCECCGESIVCTVVAKQKSFYCLHCQQ